MSDTTTDETPATPVTVTITTSGAAITITAPLAARDVLALAQAAHKEAHARCVAAPSHLGGVL